MHPRDLPKFTPVVRVLIGLIAVVTIYLLLSYLGYIPTL